MGNKTKKIIEKFEKNKYRNILEGVAVGAVTGLVVSFFRLSLQKAESLRGSVLRIAENGPEGLALAFALLAACFVIVWFCSRKVPLCGGSGIPQVKGEMLGRIEQNWWQILLAKFAGGVAAIGAGLSLGREGPSIQLGAMVGKGFARLNGKLRTEEKLLMTCGAGAGLSGAFCAPMAGVVFALEELHKNFSTEIMITTMAASVTADFVSSVMFGLEPAFGLHVDAKLPLNQYWLVLLLGVILGCFGVFYNWMTARIQDLYDKVPRKSLKVAIPFALAVLFACCYPIVLGSGHELVAEVAEGHFALKALALLLIVKFFFSLFSFGSGVPGGIFLPLLVLGSITGGLFAIGTGQLLGYDEIYLANFVIMGMTGFFASIVRAPVTGVILITEMAGDFKNFLPLAIVALVSYLVADLLHGEPIYEQLLDRMLGTGKKHGTTKETKSHKVLIETDVYIGCRMDGQPIEKMLLPQGCLIVSVQREKKEIVPSGSTVLKGGDRLILLCSQGDVHVVEEKLNNICKKIKF
ncbi:MAG: ClC family H(+)/Cl(-) exchange transporter [Firmicutes bacterium]|nr:ClC family H(+)/Cl(-) exchange transporter [Bacillota bacterium]